MHEWEKELLLWLLLLLILLNSLGAPDHAFFAIIYSIAAIENNCPTARGHGFWVHPAP